MAILRKNVENLIKLMNLYSVNVFQKISCLFYTLFINYQINLNQSDLTNFNLVLSLPY